MSSTQKTLLTLLALSFVTFSAWVVLRGQSNSFQPPSTPTVISDAGFVVNIPQKALIKNYVTVSAKASLGTNCKLTYIPPSGNVYQTHTIVDASGLCTWKWKVEESDGKGNGRLIFTIGNSSETHFIEIRSSF
jgi:hypothetical protein